MLWIWTISKSLYIAFVSNSVDHWGRLFWLTQSYYEIFLVSYNRFPVAQVNMAEVHARCLSWYDQRNCRLCHQVAAWVTAGSDCSSQVACCFWWMSLTWHGWQQSMHLTTLEHSALTSRWPSLERHFAMTRRGYHGSGEFSERTRDCCTMPVRYVVGCWWR